MSGAFPPDYRRTTASMYLDDCGIVLRTVRYDDKSLVAHLFTRSTGHVSFMVSRPRSRTSSTATLLPLLTPLSALSFQWEPKPLAALHRMRDAHALCVWQTIPVDPVKSAVALLLSEALSATLSGEGENEALFEFIIDSLHWFDSATSDYANFHLVFLLHLTHHLGLSPDADSWVPGTAFDLESGTFVHTLLTARTILQPTDAELFHRLLTADYNTMADIRINRFDRSRILAAINRFLCIHVPGFTGLRSIEVLETLFG